MRAALDEIRRFADAPATRRAVLWSKANLFSSTGQHGADADRGLLSRASHRLVHRLGDRSARCYSGSDGSACRAPDAGACWPFITHKLGLFMYGRYPEPQRWRVDLTYVLALAGLVPLMMPRVPGKLWLVDLHARRLSRSSHSCCCAAACCGLPFVATELWGGLLLTLVVASVGIAGSFPLGILLALGRRSDLPIVRWVSIGYIEFVRGVPLVTVLFMSSVMLPLFLPPGRDLRQAPARAHRRGAVLGGLSRRGDPRRPAGDPARPV